MIFATQGTLVSGNLHGIVSAAQVSPALVPLRPILRPISPCLSVLSSLILDGFLKGYEVSSL